MPASTRLPLRTFNGTLDSDGPGGAYPYIETTDQSWAGIPDFSYRFDPDKKCQLTTNGHIMDHLPLTENVWIYGGGDAGKTHHMIGKLLRRNLARTRAGHVWGTLVINQYKHSVTDENVPVFFDHLDDLGLPRDGNHWTGNSETKGRWTYEMPGGENYFRFGLINKPESAKGRRAARDKYFNEVSQMTPRTVREFGFRSKGRSWYDANPNIPTVFNQLREEGKLGDYTFVRLDHRYNEMCPANIRAKYKLMETIDPENYRIMGRGHFGTVDRLIYKHIKQIDSIPPYAHLVGRGLDWGGSDGDPMAMVAIWRAVFPIPGGHSAAVFFVDEEAYSTHMGVDDLANRLWRLQMPHAPIIADNSGKASIRRLRSLGFTVLKSESKNGNVVEGINDIKARIVFYTARSENFHRELASYDWGRDINDNPTGKPRVRAADHLMDAMRYGIVGLEHFPAYTPRSSILNLDRIKTRHPLAALN